MFKSKKNRMARGIKYIIIISIIVVSVAVNISVRAYTMSSSNYRMESDSINTGGVDLATSTNYRIKDTIGEIATGNSTSTSYNLFAGYRQMDESSISISGGAAATMSPNVGGISGGTATGSTTFTVMTDNSAGYALSISASTDPALKSGSYSFADYTPASPGTPDYSWSISASDSEFGFSPEGSDILAKYKDNGSACNTGSGGVSDKCWYNLSTSDEDISSSSSSNHPSGTLTTVKFQAESGASHLQEAGAYGATITATAMTN